MFVGAGFHLFKSLVIVLYEFTSCVDNLIVCCLESDLSKGYHICVSDVVFFFSSRRRHTRCLSDWSSDVCSSDLVVVRGQLTQAQAGAVVLHDLLDRTGGVVGGDLVAADDDVEMVHGVVVLAHIVRSEERRVGKECRGRWSPCQYRTEEKCSMKEV